jgi:hypothetical protein
MAVARAVGVRDNLQSNTAILAVKHKRLNLGLLLIFGENN